MSAVARWKKEKNVNGVPTVVPEHPPSWSVSAVHSRGEWRGVNHLEAVIDYPILKPDGSILTKPGYDPGTALIFEPTGAVPEIPDKPTLEHAEVARNRLLNVVSEFPFKNRVHKSAWLASLLTPLARFAFSGPAPLFFCDANVRGAGKGKLLQTASIIVTGNEMSVAIYTNDEAELRKRITSLAMAGDRMVLFDNVQGRFGNAVLDAALTTNFWEDRVLGVSKMYRGPLYATWFATGNNVELAADTPRRVCHIRLESDKEHPELRADFKHPELFAYVKKQRSRLLSAALTILRGYCVAGKPDMNLPAWGSFEGWSALVRNAVVWCGMPDPGDTRLELQEQSDTSASALGTLLRCWRKMDRKGHGLSVSQVVSNLYPADSHIPLAAEGWRDEMKEAIESLTERSDPKAIIGSLGNMMKKFAKRVVDGWFFKRAGVKHHHARWVATPVKDFYEREEAEDG
jgi:hypothetical protein